MTATTVREADALALPSGAPATPCEEGEALQIIPTRVFAIGRDPAMSRGSFYVQHVREETNVGLGVYRLESGELLELAEVSTVLEDSEVLRRHLQRVEPINDKSDRMSLWQKIGIYSMIGLGGSGLGLASYGLAREDLTFASTGLILLGSALVPMIVSFIGMAINTPTAQERTYADIRNRVFLDGEDDLAAVIAGVDAHNQRVRRECAE